VHSGPSVTLIGIHRSSSHHRLFMQQGEGGLQRFSLTLKCNSVAFN
jgi:hypothetical protein